MHTCSESRNPRNAGWCDCGHKLPVPESRERNQQLERELVEYAAKGITDPQHFLLHMQTRSGFSTTVRVGVDWLQEAREELADLGNYLVWWLQERPDHPEVERKLTALARAAEAYGLLDEEA